MSSAASFSSRSLSPASRPSPSRSHYSHSNSSNFALQFVAGGLSGSLARTLTAPLDRIKILMQTELSSVLNGGNAGAAAVYSRKYNGIMAVSRIIMSSEGVVGMFRGNLANVVRVFPYSASQFASFDLFKVMLFPHRSLTTIDRMTCGTLAACVATTLTHPLDVIRLRMTLPVDGAALPSVVSSTSRMTSPSTLDTIRLMLRERSGMWWRPFFQGYFATMLSVAPFISINFTCFDSLKQWAPPSILSQSVSSAFATSWLSPLVKMFSTPTMLVLYYGSVSGFVAQTICYPLDTVRRRMQMKNHPYRSTLHAIVSMGQHEGLHSFYRGMLANALKVVPLSAIRFMAFDYISTNIFGLASSSSSQ